MSSPSFAVYSIVYCVMIPFCNSTAGGLQLTRMLVELGLKHLTSRGGPEGSARVVWNFASRLCLWLFGW